MVSANTSPGAPSHLDNKSCPIENVSVPAETLAQVAKRRFCQSALTKPGSFLLVENFSSEFSLRDPHTLHHHDRQPFGTFCCEPGPNPHGEIEDVASNGALQFVATFCVHSGLGSEPVSNPGNPGFRRQTIF